MNVCNDKLKGFTHLPALFQASLCSAVARKIQLPKFRSLLFELLHKCRHIDPRAGTLSKTMGCTLNEHLNSGPSHDQNQIKARSDECKRPPCASRWSILEAILALQYFTTESMKRHKSHYSYLSEKSTCYNNVWSPIAQVRTKDEEKPWINLPT